MIVMARKNAVTMCPSASHQPASTSQMMFPITAPAPAEGFLTTVRPNGQEGVPRELECLDAERDRDDQDEHHQAGECVPEASQMPRGRAR